VNASLCNRQHPEFSLADELLCSLSACQMRVVDFARDCGEPNTKPVNEAIENLRQVGAPLVTGQMKGSGRGVWLELPLSGVLLDRAERYWNTVNV
jgi:hypothetical protein